MGKKRSLTGNKVSLNFLKPLPALCYESNMFEIYSGAPNVLKKMAKRKVSRKNGLAAETIGLQVSYFSKWNCLLPFSSFLFLHFF